MATSHLCTNQTAHLNGAEATEGERIQRVPYGRVAEMDTVDHNMRATRHVWPMSSETHLRNFGYLNEHPAMRFADVQLGIQRDPEVGASRNIMISPRSGALEKHASFVVQRMALTSQGPVVRERITSTQCPGDCESKLREGITMSNLHQA